MIFQRGGIANRIETAAAGPYGTGGGGFFILGA